MTVLETTAEVEDAAHEVFRPGVVKILRVQGTEKDVDLKGVTSQCIPYILLANQQVCRLVRRPNMHRYVLTSRT